MLGCRLLLGLVAAGALGLCRAEPPTAQAPNPNADLEPVARALFEKKQYKDALATYTRWEPQQRSCGSGRFALNGNRVERIAVCQAHLGDHGAAVRTCLDALQRTDCYRYPDVFLLQLYRAADQLGDLGPLLDAVEKAYLDKQPKAWLLPPEARAALLEPLRTGAIREQLKSPEQDDRELWPDGVPRPKPGSLPKALPK